MSQRLIEHPSLPDYEKEFKKIPGVGRRKGGMVQMSSTYTVLRNYLEPDFGSLDSHTDEYVVKTAALAMQTISLLDQSAQIGAVAYGLTMARVARYGGITNYAGEEICVGILRTNNLFRLPDSTFNYLLRTTAGFMGGKRFMERLEQYGVADIVRQWQKETAKNPISVATWLRDSFI